MQVQALVFHDRQKPEWTYLAHSKPTSSQVGIEVIASSLCNHSEMRSFFGSDQPGYGYEYPMKPGEPGHEAVGTVTEVGPDVTHLKKGDTVVMTGHGGDECHRSYVIKQEKDVAIIDAGDREVAHAAALEMFGCAYHCMKVLPLESGYEQKNIAIIGLGAIGLCTLMLLRQFPYASVTCFDVDERRLAMAESLFADRLVRIKTDTDPMQADQLYGTYDTVIECSGSVAGHMSAYALSHSQIIFSGYCPKPVTIKPSLWFDKNLTLFNPGILQSKDLHTVAAFYNRELIDPTVLITQTIPPAIDAYTQTVWRIKKGEIVKALIDWRDR